MQLATYNQCIYISTTFVCQVDIQGMDYKERYVVSFLLHAHSKYPTFYRRLQLITLEEQYVFAIPNS